MKKTLYVLMAGALSCACAAAPDDGGFYCPAGDDPAALVDPLIGSRGPGNVIPGPMLPHGMVKLSPDSVVEPGSVDAYEWSSDRIEGFSHTHLQGPGGGSNGYSHILLLPQTGPLQTDPKLYPSRFSHDNEVAEPGYYAVTLDDYEVRVELTASAHAGFHRYTFPPAGPARVLIDIGHSRGDSRGGRVEFTDDHTVSGYGVYNVHPLVDLVLSKPDNVVGRSQVYFVAEFNRPFSEHGTWQGRGDELTVSEGAGSGEGAWLGAWAGFPAAAGEVVEARVGISLVSVAQARRNLDEELAGRSFEQVRAAARARWNCYLNRVQVVGGNAAQRRMFYTALYHTLLAPTDYTEPGGVFFSGADGRGEVFRDKDFDFYSDDWCAWDTFRTSRPLATLIEPETVSDVISSYLHLYRQGGWLPKCTWHATGYSSVMIGNHAVSLIADAYVKGLRDYDPELAWKAVYHSATAESLERFFEGGCGYANLGTPPEYLENGYVSHECDAHQSASMTLEYAYDDWCVAQLAAAQGRAEQEQVFRARAQNWRNQFNPDSGFMQGRHRDGSWVGGFDPADNSDANDFCEANAWIYTWFVPHDPAGLMEVLGGRQAFLEKLEQFFAGDYFDVSNEPSFHIPFLFNPAGEPSRSQELVREILAASFSDQPAGLPGNDDAGATSAWLAFAAMGLYPLAPGDGRYQIVSPWFERVTLRLGPRRSFTISAPGASATNRYIQLARLNGCPLTEPLLEHRQIVAGGILELQLGPTPTEWGRGD